MNQVPESGSTRLSAVRYTSRGVRVLSFILLKLLSKQPGSVSTSPLQLLTWFSGTRKLIHFLLSSHGRQLPGERPVLPGPLQPGRLRRRCSVLRKKETERLGWSQGQRKWCTGTRSGDFGLAHSKCRPVDRFSRRKFSSLTCYALKSCTRHSLFSLRVLTWHHPKLHYLEYLKEISSVALPKGAWSRKL